MTSGRGRRGQGQPVELVQDSHLRIGNGIGVVVAVNRSHVRLTLIEIKANHLMLTPLDQVDRLLVERGGRGAEVDLADDTGIVGSIDHYEVI